MLAAVFLCANAAFAGISGHYEGSYSSSDGSVEGKVNSSVMKKADASWDCSWSFTYEGEEIAAKAVSCSVDENKLVAEYEADVDGSPIRVKLEGQADGETTIAGIYKASDESGNVVGEGKWKLSLKH